MLEENEKLSYPKEFIKNVIFISITSKNWFPTKRKTTKLVEYKVTINPK